MGTVSGYQFNMSGFRLLALSILFASVSSQDTNFCPDGWELYSLSLEGSTHHLCFLFGDAGEQVSYDSAKIICQSHGAFLSEAPQFTRVYSWLVDRLLEKQAKQPDYGHQYWLAARKESQGAWAWDHSGISIEWFDWGNNQPDRGQYQQSCLSLLYYSDLLGITNNFHWNDNDCKEVASFICEKIAN